LTPNAPRKQVAAMPAISMNESVPETNGRSPSALPIDTSQLARDGAELKRDANNRNHKRHDFHCDEDHPRCPFVVRQRLPVGLESMSAIAN